MNVEEIISKIPNEFPYEIVKFGKTSYDANVDIYTKSLLIDDQIVKIQWTGEFAKEIKPITDEVTLEVILDAFVENIEKELKY